MNIAGVRLGPVPERDRVELLRRAREAMPTYDHVGSTLDPFRWAEAAVQTHSVEVGRGEAAFRAARTALQTFVAQRGIGADIIPANPVVAIDETVVLVLRRGPLCVIAPTRIVEVIDEPSRFAFAYGTLPGHPERGEESFAIEQLPDSTVRATIRVQAGPGTLAAKVGAPIVRRLQTAALRAYLKAIASHVTAEAASGPPERTDP